MSLQIIINKEMLEGFSKTTLLEIMLSQTQQSSTTPVPLEEVKQVKSKIRPRWTPRQDAELLANLALGFTVTELADLHGRTYASVKARLYRLSEPSAKKKRHKWTVEQDQALLADIAAGCSIASHAKRAGRTYGSVSKRLDRLRKTQILRKGNQL